MVFNNAGIATYGQSPDLDPAEWHRVIDVDLHGVFYGCRAAIPHLRNLLTAFNIPVLEYPGVEADDVIGTLARKAEQQGFETYMVTPDKDYAQLVDEHTFLLKPGRGGGDSELLDVAKILEQWNISRIDQVIDILGLAGDTADNIPGIPGVGAQPGPLAQTASPHPCRSHCRKQGTSFPGHPTVRRTAEIPGTTPRSGSASPPAWPRHHGAEQLGP